MYPRNSKIFDWPDEYVERLKKLWSEGLSASIIAMHLGNGLSRNAIIGKAYRLELDSRVTTTSVYGRVRARREAGNGAAKIRKTYGATAFAMSPQRAAMQKILAEGGPLPPPAETDVARVSFADMETHKHCRFIPGDPCQEFKPDKALYCGLQPVPGAAYCPSHLQRCSEAPRPIPPRQYEPIRRREYA